MASSAWYRPPLSDALGSFERPVRRVFILSISTPWSLDKSETNSNIKGS